MARTIAISPSDVSLFHVAARELGDATQAERIARLNGLSDPAITALATIVLPPVDSTAGGGVPPQ